MNTKCKRTAHFLRSHIHLSHFQYCRTLGFGWQNCGLSVPMCALVCAYENTLTHYNKGRFIMCREHVITRACAEMPPQLVEWMKQGISKVWDVNQPNSSYTCDLLLYFTISVYLFIKWLHSSVNLFASFDIHEKKISRLFVLAIYNGRGGLASTRSIWKANKSMNWTKKSASRKSITNNEERT